MRWTLTALAAIGALIATASIDNALAFPHAHMTITPTEEHAKPISVSVGHSDEPAYGVESELHQGKHNFEVMLEDAATALPLSGAQLKVDKYYFADFQSFENADSVGDATEVQGNVTLGSVFGEQGRYVARQVVSDGIYGYRLYGTVDYFGVAEVPVDATIFCNSSEGNTTKFNSEGWGGGFGCPENINSLRFPSQNQTDSSANVQPTAGTGDGQQYQMLSIGLVGAGIAAFFGIRELRKRDRRD